MRVALRPLPCLTKFWMLLVTTACASGGGAPPAPVSAQAPARPRPYPVFETRAFAAAVDAGTRTRTGRPGPRYWQQYARYQLSATLDPATARLDGSGIITYLNRSPDTLAAVYLQLYNNLFAPTGMRNELVPVVGAVDVRSVAVEGRAFTTVAEDGRGPGYEVESTMLRLALERPLLPNDSVRMAIEWALTVPPDGAPRGGTDGEVYFVSYWYPQVAVYDDVDRRWHTDPYMGNAEFYMGYGDYDVSLTVPAGFLIGATGTLRNPEQVLTPQVRARLDSAARGRGIVRVVRDDERGVGRATPRGDADGRLTWRFTATNVRDFAFGASDAYLWDATMAVAGDADGDGRADSAQIHAFYRPERRQWAWGHSARYGQHSIEFLSRYLWPYAYPQMTVVDGVTSCAGMEYPMITCIGGPRDTLGLYSVTVHEIAHMWFPMRVGSDEKRYSWQDEGLTRFNQAQAMQEFFAPYDRERLSRENYLNLARQGSASEAGLVGEVELMRHGDLYPVGTPAFGIASYDKMATNLVALRAILGDSVFLRAYREYGRRWLEKHPQPYDLWNTFEDVAARDLDWFWRTWFFETWTLDQALTSARRAGGSVELVIEDRGLAPMPVRLAITRAGGAVERMEVPVEVWLGGARRHVIRIPDSPRIERIAIDPEERFPDVDRGNNEIVVR
ncbi:MAG TPA: M1 family metallopeptidase [Gemmatimonadaceae bacterium]|nr:M1 family metallopeptidase [Gemmatimonadaceae bacterium]